MPASRLLWEVLRLVATALERLSLGTLTSATLEFRSQARSRKPFLLYVLIVAMRRRPERRRWRIRMGVLSKVTAESKEPGGPKMMVIPFHHSRLACHSVRHLESNHHQRRISRLWLHKLTRRTLPRAATIPEPHLIFPPSPTPGTSQQSLEEKPAKSLPRLNFNSKNRQRTSMPRDLLHRGRYASGLPGYGFYGASSDEKASPVVETHVDGEKASEPPKRLIRRTHYRLLLNRSNFALVRSTSHLVSQQNPHPLQSFPRPYLRLADWQLQDLREVHPRLLLKNPGKYPYSQKSGPFSRLRYQCQKVRLHLPKSKMGAPSVNPPLRRSTPLCAISMRLKWNLLLLKRIFQNGINQAQRGVFRYQNGTNLLLSVCSRKIRCVAMHQAPALEDFMLYLVRHCRRGISLERLMIHSSLAILSRLYITLMLHIATLPVIGMTS